MQVNDSGALRAADGREVVLSGLADVEPTTARVAAIAATQNLSLEAVADADRYGRSPVLAYADGGSQPIQIGLLARGDAFISPLRLAGLSPPCRAALKQAEAVARKARLGLWADPRYAVRRADRGADLLTARGRLALAEGKVVSVRESGGVIYLNFGRRWSEALTVTVLKRHEKRIADAGVDIRQLAQRRILARGWVEERNGPRIDVSHPEQIEMADE